MNIGDILTAPAAGYQRIDSTNGCILLGGGNVCVDDLTHGYYNYSYKTINLKDEYIEFKVYTTKLRIFVAMHNGCNINNNHDIFIDDILISSKSSYLNTDYNSTSGQRFLFEKTDMSKDFHTIKLINNEDGYLLLDCIDIDIDGFLPTRTYHGIANIGLIKTSDKLLGIEELPLSSDLSNLKTDNKLLSFPNINNKINSITEPYSIIKTSYIDDNITSRYIKYDGITYELALQINKDDTNWREGTNLFKNNVLINDGNYNNNINGKYNCFITKPFNKLIYELNEISLHLSLNTIYSSLMVFLNGSKNIIPIIDIKEGNAIESTDVSPFGLSRIRSGGKATGSGLVTDYGGCACRVGLGTQFPWYSTEGIFLNESSSGTFAIGGIRNCYAHAKLYIALV